MTTLAYPVQLQSFSLSGSGSSIGDTVLNLKSFKDILGVNLDITSFGNIGYGTLEPGNGVQEEQVSFSGITQNSDGTAQLTGVKHVLFKSPFTETSGMTITHPGSVVFVISNTAAFENTLYVALNSAVASGGVTATSTQNGITKLSVNPASIGVPIAVGNNDNRVPSVNASSITAGQLAALFGDNTDIAIGSGNKYVSQTGLQKDAENFAASTGSANSYAITLSPVPASLASGMPFRFLANFANVSASASTLNINSLGAKTLKKNYNVDLVAGDIVAGQMVSGAYDGAAMQVQSPVPVTPLAAIGIGTTNIVSSSAETTILTFTLPANKLGATGGLTFSVPFYTNTGTGVSSSGTFRLYIGATAIATVTKTTTDWSTPYGAISGTIFNNTASSQTGTLAVLDIVNKLGGVATGTAAIDTTSNQTVKFTFQASANSSSVGINFYNPTFQYAANL